MTTAALFGCTGAVGSQILTTLLVADAFSSVKTISRKLPDAQSPKLQALEAGDVSTWGGRVEIVPTISGVSTTNTIRKMTYPGT